MAIMAMNYNIVWLIFRHFRSLPLGSLPEKNSEIVENITPLDDTIPNMSYAIARPKQRAAVAFTPQLKPNEDTPPKKMTISCTFRSSSNQ